MTVSTINTPQPNVNYFDALSRRWYGATFVRRTRPGHTHLGHFEFAPITPTYAQDIRAERHLKGDVIVWGNEDDVENVHYIQWLEDETEAIQRMELEMLEMEFAAQNDYDQTIDDFLMGTRI